jgi:hypothetical protein
VRLELLPPMSPPRARDRREARAGVALAVVLFLVTLFTTVTLGGAWATLARGDVAPGIAPLLTPSTVSLVWRDDALRGQGFAFALPTLFILLCHELGHWFACRHHRVPTTMPFFLPAPLGLGTFGAFIHLQRPIRDRRELLDIGVWGPLAGFAALLPFLVLGAVLSQPSRLTDSLVTADALPRLRLGENLLIAGALRLVHGELAPGVVLNPHPFLLAAWVGSCATMLNLLPLGRLDGGHIVYAASGALQRLFAWPLWALLVLLGALWPWWWLWSLMILVLGMHHPRVYDEERPLDPARAGLALTALVLFAITFMPVPVRLETTPAPDGNGSGIGRQIDDERDRPVVHELDRHARAEAAAGDLEAGGTPELDQALESGTSLLGRRRALERRPAPARERGQESELGDQQDRAAGGAQVEIHLPVGVVEQTQVDDFLRRRGDLAFAVADSHSREHQEAATDRAELFAAGRNTRARDALQD